MVQIHTSATSQPGLVSARTLVTYTIVINNKTNWHPSCHYNIIVSNHMVQSPNSDVLTYQKEKKRGALISYISPHQPYCARLFIIIILIGRLDQLASTHHIFVQQWKAKTP
jgi:hypothetical protein